MQSGSAGNVSSRLISCKFASWQYKFEATSGGSAAWLESPSAIDAATSGFFGLKPHDGLTLVLLPRKDDEGFLGRLMRHMESGLLTAELYVPEIFEETLHRHRNGLAFDGECGMEVHPLPTADYRLRPQGTDSAGSGAGVVDEIDKWQPVMRVAAVNFLIQGKA